MRGIEIVLNGKRRGLGDVSPTMTLLDWLRGPAGLKGTKEGCAEGDCGACTVALERLDGGGGLARAPINACLAMVGQLDGCAVRTVEGLRGLDGAPHPVQTAMAEGDATQCGFCTPGFVMAAYAFSAGGEPPDPAAVHDALAGNLCRCTGYRPIVDAMRRVACLSEDPLAASAAATAAALEALAEERREEGAAGGPPRVFAHAGGPFAPGAQAFHAPRTMGELLALRARHPEAPLLAGGTDLGLLPSRERARPARLIHVAHVPELLAMREDTDTLEIGAAVAFADALPALDRLFPDFGRLVRRIGSRQIRSLGTFGGNLGTASPIGDALPVLLALGASARLRSAGGARTVPLDAFFLGYRRTALASDEIVESVALPKLGPDERFHCAKVSKRRDQDISATLAACRLRLADGVVVEARLAFGGMAATPTRAPAAEAALLGAPWGEAAAGRAAAALAGDFRPLDDWRASAEYRLAAAGNLLRRFARRDADPAAALDLDAL